MNYIFFLLVFLLKSCWNHSIYCLILQKNNEPASIIVRLKVHCEVVCVRSFTPRTSKIGVARVHMHTYIWDTAWDRSWAWRFQTVRNKVVEWVASYSNMFRSSIRCPVPFVWITTVSRLGCWQQCAYNYCSYEQPKHQQRFVQQLRRRWRCADYRTEEDHHVEGLESAWVFSTLYTYCMRVLFHKRSRSRWSLKGFSIRRNKVSK